MDVIMKSYERPLVIGINSQFPTAARPLPQRLSAYGDNTGNMLFSEALYQVIGHGKRSRYHFHPSEADDCDAIVVAAANWVNPYSDFTNLATRLEALQKPVVLIGLGSQYSAGEPHTITAGTRALLDLASRTSGLLSVRGEQSREDLSLLGYSNTAVTGCPSLLLSNGVFPAPAAPAEATSKNTVLMGTRHFDNPASDLQRPIYELAYRSRSHIIMQSELADLYFVEDMPRAQEIAASGNAALRQSYGETDVTLIRHYLRQYGHVFFDPVDWRAFLEGFEYVVGSRIHGAIAAVLSGKRAILLTHDGRTAELAATLGIPSYPQVDFKDASYSTINRIVGEMNFDLTRTNYRRYESGFQSFFNTVGLRREKARGFGVEPPSRA